jgi:hypothetical protein
MGDTAQRPWNGSPAAGLIEETEPGGPVTMVVYLMQEGHSLPNVEFDEAVN